MGKSRGGLSTKIHAAIDGLGNPVRFLLTAGQCSEMTQSDALIEGFSADYVIDELIGVIESTQTTAVIPPTLAPSTSAKASGISITPVPASEIISSTLARLVMCGPGNQGNDNDSENQIIVQ